MKRLLLALFIVLLTGCEQKPPQSKAETWPLVKQCNLHQQACTAEHNGQKVTLDIAPKPIPVANPLKVSVTLDNLTAQALQIDINGHNMYMGYNRLPLEKVDEHHWRGSTMLAFCTNAKMEWIITLIIDKPDGHQLRIPFYLETKSRY